MGLDPFCASNATLTWYIRNADADADANVDANVTCKQAFRMNQRRLQDVLLKRATTPGKGANF